MAPIARILAGLYLHVALGLLHVAACLHDEVLAVAAEPTELQLKIPSSPSLLLIQRAARFYRHSKKTKHAENQTAWSQTKRPGRLEQWRGRITREIKKRVVIVEEILETVSQNNTSGSSDGPSAVDDGVGDVAELVNGVGRGSSRGAASPRGAGGQVRANGTTVSTADEEEEEVAAEQVALGEMQAAATSDVDATGEVDGGEEDSLRPELALDQRQHAPPRRPAPQQRGQASEEKAQGPASLLQNRFAARARSEKGAPGSVGEKATTAAQGLDPYETPIDAAMSASVAVTLTYFVVYVSVTSVKTWNQARQHSFCSVERVLESTMSAVYFAPMLCTVFLAVTKRAETVSRGNPALYGLPPTFVQVAVIVTAAAFCLHVAFWFMGELAVAAARPAPLGRAHRPVREKAGDGSSSGGTWKDSGWIWVWLSHASVAIMHVALNVVFIGITLMREPEELYNSQGSPKMSAGTVCTLTLAIPYFAVYLVLHALQPRSAELARLSEKSDRHGASSSSFPDPMSLSASSAPFSLVLTEVAKLTATSLGLAPMLCVLFLGTQLAEEWAGEVHPPGYVEACMYMCTAAVYTQMVLAVVAPFAAGAELHPIGPDGELDFVTRNHRMFRLVGLLRWIVMTALYVGVEVVCASLWSLYALLPITRLLRHLVGCYFLMYAIQWLVSCLRELVGSGFANAIRVLRIAKDVVSFCPMLAVLFLETWVRSAHVKNKEGNPGVPQCYAQDCMYLATLAFLVQLLIVLLSGIISRTPVSTTSHRSPSQHRDCVAFVLLAFFHAATLVLCGSVAVVIGSIFTLTPENADATGAWISSLQVY